MERSKDSYITEEVLTINGPHRSPHGPVVQKHKLVYFHCILTGVPEICYFPDNEVQVSQKWTNYVIIQSQMLCPAAQNTQLAPER